MEGYLEKKEEGFFGGWTKYYFILHEEMLYQLEKEQGRTMGSIHMKVAKVYPDQADKLVLHLFNGTNEILLRAATIKENVQWYNALYTAQKQCNEGRYDHLKAKNKKQSPRKEEPDNIMRQSLAFSEGGFKQLAQAAPPSVSSASDYHGSTSGGTSMHDRLNMRFFSKVFHPEAPLFQRMGTIWELEASLQEVISLLLPEATRTGNPLLKNYANHIADITTQMKVI